MGLLPEALKRGLASYCDPPSLFAALLTQRDVSPDGMQDKPSILQEALRTNLRSTCEQHGLPYDLIRDICSDGAVFSGGLLLKALWGPVVQWRDNLLTANVCIKHSAAIRTHSLLIDAGYRLRSSSSELAKILTEARLGVRFASEGQTPTLTTLAKHQVRSVLKYERNIAPSAGQPVHPASTIYVFVATQTIQSPKELLSWCTLCARRSFFDGRNVHVTDPSQTFRVETKLDHKSCTFVCAFASKYTNTLACGSHGQSLGVLPMIWTSAVKAAAHACVAKGISLDAFPIKGFGKLLRTLTRLRPGSMPYTLPAAFQLFRWISFFVDRVAEYEQIGVQMDPKSPCEGCRTWAAFQSVMQALDNASATLASIHMFPPCREPSEYETAARAFKQNQAVVLQDMTLHMYGAAMYLKARASQWEQCVRKHVYRPGAFDAGTGPTSTVSAHVAAACREALLELWPRGAIEHYGVQRNTRWDDGLKCPFLAHALADKYGYEVFVDCADDYESEVSVGFLHLVVVRISFGSKLHHYCNLYSFVLVMFVTSIP